MPRKAFTTSNLIVKSSTQGCETMFFLHYNDVVLLVLPLDAGFAPDGGQGAERDEGAGLCQGQFAESLHPWRSGCPDPRGQPSPQSLCHLGAGSEGASDSL